MWHFKNKSQIDDLQSQIKHQNNENKRIQLKSNFETSILRCFLNGKMKEINFIQEDLCNTVQVLQNELMEKDSKIHLMKQEQELQGLKLRKELWMKEATERFIVKSGLSLRLEWSIEKVTLAMDWQTEQFKVEVQRKFSELGESAYQKKETEVQGIFRTLQESLNNNFESPRR